MRKFQWFFLAVAAAAASLAFVGCSGGAQNGSSAAASAVGSETAQSAQTEQADAGKVVFWNDKLIDAAEQSAIMTPWEAAYGGKVETTSYRDNAAYRTAVSQSIDTKSAPNLFTWWTGEQLETLVENDKLLELDDVWEELVELGVPEDVKDAFSYNGHVYAAPYSLLNNVCYYNVEAFEKAGIESVPATFDEFIEACDKLLAAGIKPIGDRNNSWASFVWFQAIIAAYDADLYQGICDGSIPYDDPKMVEAMTIFKEMIDKGYFADPIQDTDNFRRFAVGEVGMILDGQHQIPKLSANYGMVSGEDFDVFVLPSMDGKKAVLFFEATPMVAPKAVENPEDSKEFIKAYYTQETQKATLATKGNLLISALSVEDPTLKKVSEFAADTETYVSLLRFYENTPSELRDFVITEMSKFMAGASSVEDTLKACASEASKYFN